MTSHIAPQDTTVEVASRWDALFDGNARAVLERALPGYVSARRWYRTKTRRVQSARITAAFPLAHGSELARIAIVDLLLDDGERDTYVVPLAFVSVEEASRLRARRPHALVLPLRVTGGRESRDGYVVDALALESFLGELLGAIARSTTLEDSGATLQFHALAGVKPNGGVARPVDSEQTNTSVLFGESYVGKVVRKIDPGESPDLELGRFLTEVRYPHTPALHGFIELRRGDSAPSTVGLLHAFVPNRGDAWTHVLEILDEWLTSASHRDKAPPRLPPGDLVTRASAALPPEVANALGPYGPLAEKLGRRVGEMHVALASRPGDAVFALERLDRETREMQVEAARSDLKRALDGLGARGPAMSDPAREALAAIRAGVRRIDARLTQAARLREAGVKMRVHGDLHLGQVLFTGDDFVLIDFEGEPARSLEERKAKRSPLVDVAGMLRSFHYASVSALRARPESARAALAPWAAFWYRAVAASFLRGWLSAVEGTIVVPEEPASTRCLLDLYLFEKGIYEVGYEMNNRPDWVDIPLEGVREILGDGEREGEGEGESGTGTGTATLETRGNTPVPTTKPSLTSPAVVPTAPVARVAHWAVSPSMLDPRSPAVAAFRGGKATHAHALLGAHPHQDGATDFSVWAPNAARVSVVGDFNDWKIDAAPLAQVGSTGIYAARVRGVQPGHRYKYRITPAGGRAQEPFDKIDPFGVSAELPPGNASIVCSLAYGWGDDGWMEKRVQNARLDRPMSIYEVHLGSWRRNVEEGDRHLTYREIAAPLAAHAKAMGFTHVELMPLLEHPFYGSWGYGVTGFFAATSRYGSPSDLMYLVDTLHQAGLGVIFDWVPAHFASDLHGLTMFDGTAVFEPKDPARAVHPTWGTGVFDFDKPEVRSFLLSSAIFWIETFHADGLRIDGVESILYADHHAGKEEPGGVSFLRELTSTLKIEHPEVILAAEDSSAWPGVTHAASAGGLGFDLKWDMGFSHDMRRYLAIDPIERSQHQAVLTFRSVYAANESFVIPLSHDDVIEERGGALLDQMHGDPWQKLANLRLLYAMMFAQPGKKLLFMGNELAQPSAWHHDRSLDWHVARDPAHDGIARMVGDLNHVYRETPALHAGDATANGFEWIDGTNSQMSVIAFLRRGRGDDDVAVVACNFTPVPRHQYRIGVPRAGHWREIFNSDARDYGGSGHGNLGGVDAVPYPWNGRPSSVVVTLPPLGAIILAR
ncbi:MAG: 1,4-alpha-glucan (glycogen) branching enzyme GH3-type [Myxococcaceae bacterium]|nr:1,4-alpha-glucan (glycogen) branching enzyme GH3-type [Myxococcaceae bacterium]